MSHPLVSTMYRLQRLRPVRQVRKARSAVQQASSNPSTRTFSTSHCLRRDDFDTEEPENSQPRRSGAEKLARQEDAMSVLGNLDDQTSSDFLNEPSDLPASPIKSQRRGETPDLNLNDSESIRPRDSTRTGPPARRKTEESEDDNTMEALDEYSDQFASEKEEMGYEEVFGQTQKLLKQTRKIRAVQEKPEVKNNPQGDVAKQCEMELRQLDDGIKTALQTMLTLKDQAFVPFKPDGVNVKEFYKSQTGAAGAGDGGVGNVMEDSLRYLGGREGHKWQHPRDIASRLAQGELVKFKSHTERKQVLAALQNVAQEPGKSEWRKVKFQPLTPEARRSLAQRAMFGQSAGIGRQQEPLLEAGQLKGPQDVMNSARRVATGQFRGPQMQAFLQTIGELLPQDRGRPQQQARK